MALTSDLVPPVPPMSGVFTEAGTLASVSRMAFSSLHPDNHSQLTASMQWAWLASEARPSFACLAKEAMEELPKPHTARHFLFLKGVTHPGNCRSQTSGKVCQ